jgi:integrase
MPTKRTADLTNDLVVKNLRVGPGDPKRFEVKCKGKPGFYLRISSGGTKTWLYRYTLAGNLRRLPLGRYPAVSCSGAFSAYEQARSRVKVGEDVYLTDSAVKHRESLTLSVLFHDHYFPRYAASKRTAHNDRRYFEGKIEPALGDRPATGIEPVDVEKLLRPIERSTYTTARLTLAVLRKMYNWAVLPESAPVAGAAPVLPDDILNPCRIYKLGKPPETSIRALSHAEIREVWGALTHTHSDRIIKLQLLTGCRVSEVCGMAESEILREEREWIIPGKRTKNGRDHVVPLTPHMLALIGEEVKSFVFHAASSSGHTMSSGPYQSLRRICDARKIKGVGTHTLRKTFVTGLSRLHVHREIRDRLTNHADPTVDGRHYNAHDFLRDKRDALELWDKELLKIVDQEGAQVLRYRGERDE